MKKKQTAGVVAAAAAAVAMLGGPGAARADLRINEVLYDAPGANAAQDYIELRSTTGGVETVTGLTMIMLEGDTGGNAGVIDSVVPLTGSTGTNGLFLRHNFTTLPSTADPATGIEKAGWSHENTAITYLLVSGFTGAATTDLDTNDDGVLDSTPWTSVVDGFGVLDGDVASDKVYGVSAAHGADFNEGVSGTPNTDSTKPPVTGGVVFRTPDGTYQTALVSGSAGSYTVTSSDTVNTGYTLTPGSANNALTTSVHSWIGASGATWNDATRWNGGVVPSTSADIATFDGGGGQTISLDTNITLGGIAFLGGSHNITAGGGTLTLNKAASGNAAVRVSSGNPVISAPIVLAKNATFYTGRGMSITVGTVDGPFGLSKQGLGTGTFGTFNVGALSMTSGTMVMAPGQTTASVATSFTRSGTTAKLDIKDNKLILTTAGLVGTWNATTLAYDATTGLVATGHAGGAQNGLGIVSSLAANNSDYTEVGVAKASEVKGIGDADTDVFAGRTVHGSDTIVMYTYGGDANLDGLINIDDYTQIDSSVATGGALKGWFNGDFNYDGEINIDDYTIIDSNIGIQGPPFSTAGGAGVAAATAVPEPASFAAGAVAFLGLATRRRRERRRGN